MFYKINILIKYLKLGLYYGKKFILLMFDSALKVYLIITWSKLVNIRHLMILAFFAFLDKI